MPRSTDDQADHVEPVRALDQLLRARPGAVVAALEPAGRLRPVPASVPLHGQQRYEGRTGLDLVVPPDHHVVIGALERAQHEPVVTVEVRLLADVAHPVRLHLFDRRQDLGVHLVVVDADDPDLVWRSARLRDARRRRVAHLERDGFGVILSADDAMADLLGWPAASLVGRSTVELVHPDDQDRAIEAWMAMRAGVGAGRVRVRYRHADGRYLWLEVSNEDGLGDPAIGRVRSELVDVTEEMAHLDDLRARERLLARLAETLPIGVCHIRSDGRVAYTNAAMANLLGPVAHRIDLLGAVDEHDRPLVSTALDAGLAGRPGSLEVELHPRLAPRRCELTFRPLASADDTDDGVIICGTDVTLRRRMEAELEHRADHDSLTGCLNRRATLRALRESLHGAAQTAVAFIDLDDFKVVNDELGHAAGDEVLRQVVGRLRRAIRAEDRLGRIGGDEFVVICPLHEGRPEPSDLERRLLQAVDADVAVEGQPVHLTASIGMAVSTPGEVDADAVLGRADAAMYATKRAEAPGATRRPGNLRAV